MLQNAYFLANIGADTAENERNFAESCQKLATTLRTGTCSGAAHDLREAAGPRLGLRPRAAHGPGGAAALAGARAPVGCYSPSSLLLRANFRGFVLGCIEATFSKYN